MASKVTFVLEDRFILFLDFLGTSAAAAQWDNARISQFIGLLTWVENQRRSGNVEGHRLPDGGYKFKLAAETSTFSDHIVLSYPLPEGATDDLRSLWIEMVIQDIRRIVAYVAIQALQVGLLVRGGLAFGSVYHSSNVVFGKGMVDAYTLENKVAVYPRVVISPRVLDLVTIAKAIDNKVVQDSDGVTHLRYVSYMRHIVAGEPNDSSLVARWKADTLAFIDGEITRLRQQGRMNELAKWGWFKNEFEGEINPEAASELGPHVVGTFLRR